MTKLSILELELLSNDDKTIQSFRVDFRLLVYCALAVRFWLLGSVEGEKRTKLVSAPFGILLGKLSFFSLRERRERERKSGDSTVCLLCALFAVLCKPANPLHSPSTIGP